MKNQLQYYVETNNLLIKEQSGFRAKHSCETALNLVLSQWKEDLNCHLNVVAVFIDLKRAFETIDRDRMLEKLEYIGIKILSLTGLEISFVIAANKQ